MGGEGYDATRRLGPRPPNWGLLPDAAVRVDVTHVEGTAAVLTLTLDGETVTAARFKSRGVAPDRLPLLARAIAALEGRTLRELSTWRLPALAGAMGTAAPRPGPDQTVLGLALLALQHAVEAAARAGGASPPIAASVGATICYCMDVSDATILDAVRTRGATTVDQITATTGAGGGCGTCRPDIQALLDRAGVEPRPDDPTAPYRNASGPPWIIDADAAGDADEERG